MCRHSAAQRQRLQSKHDSDFISQKLEAADMWQEANSFVRVQNSITEWWMHLQCHNILRVKHQSYTFECFFYLFVCLENWVWNSRISLVLFSFFSKSFLRLSDTQFCYSNSCCSEQTCYAVQWWRVWTTSWMVLCDDKHDSSCQRMDSAASVPSHEVDRMETNRSFSNIWTLYVQAPFNSMSLLISSVPKFLLFSVFSQNGWVLSCQTPL